MKRTGRRFEGRGLKLLVSVLIPLGFLAPGKALGGWKQVNEDGFGSTLVSECHYMAFFNNHLYAVSRFSPAKISRLNSMKS